MALCPQVALHADRACGRRCPSSSVPQLALPRPHLAQQPHDLLVLHLARLVHTLARQSRVLHNRTRP